MLDTVGPSGGGHVVGLEPDGALALASLMTARGSQGGCAAGRIAGMLDEAGAEGADCRTPVVLRNLDAWLERSATDVRWRVAMVAGDAPGGRMRFATLLFESAAEATADGRRYAAQIDAALHRWFDADDDDRAAAEADLFALLRGAGSLLHDPAWAGGLVNRLGSDGFSNGLFIAAGAAQGDVGELRRSLGPVFGALATAMRQGTVDPELRRDILRWPNYDLALIVALAPADTAFLTTVARRVLVLSQTDDDRATDPNTREYELVLGALADIPEASFRVLTGTGRYGEPAASYLLPANELLASSAATRALARVLEGGLVEYPAGRGAWEWNRATRATEVVMHDVARMRYVFDEVDPALNAAVVSLLRPHLDTIAVIGARAGGMTAPDPLDVRLAGGRRPLDVDGETLRKYLGAAMQRDSGITHVQFLLAAYAQSPTVQANRLAMLTTMRDARDLDPFFTDSVRIAGLVSLVGGGLDEAGKDEESMTRLLVGAMEFAAGKGSSKVLSGTPVSWLAQRGVRYLAGEGIEEVEDWLQSREPLEGEVAVDTFIESYADTAVASLREHIASDPELSQMSRTDRDDLLASARHLVNSSLSGPLRRSYADLVAETAKE